MTKDEFVQAFKTVLDVFHPEQAAEIWFEVLAAQEDVNIEVEVGRIADDVLHEVGRRWPHPNNPARRSK